MALGHMFCFQVMFSITTGFCTYPYSLRNKTWLYKVSAEPYIKTTVVFTENFITFQRYNLPSNQIISTNILYCQKEISFGKYLTRTTDVNVTSRRYRCIRVIERSKSIIQLAYSIYSNNDTESLCSGKLFLDDWLLVSYADIENEFVTCPLQSGFNMKITDSFGYQHACNFMDLPMRFESECLKGESLLLDLRKRDCVDFLPLNQVQTLVCVAKWTEGNFLFVVTLKANTHHLLTLRIPFYHDIFSFKVHLYTGLIAPLDNNDTGSRHFILSLEKVIQSSVCADEYPECAKNICSDYTINQCQKSCFKCDQNSSPTICSFPLMYRSEWFSSSSNYTNNVTIGESDINIASVGKFTCIVAPGRLKNSNSFTTLSLFRNGCRPRYTCIHLQKMSRNVLGYAISQSFIWPLTPSSEQICHDAQFREDSQPIFDKYRSNRHVLKPLLPLSDQTIKPIDCELSSSITFIAEVPGKIYYNGTLTRNCENTTLLHLKLNHYNNTNDTTFVCVSYLKESRQNILMLQNIHTRHHVVCLVYSLVNESQILLLPLDECDSNSLIYVENFKRTAAMTLVIEKKLDTCENIRTTTKLSTETTLSTSSVTYKSETTMTEIEKSTEQLYKPGKMSVSNNGIQIVLEKLILFSICAAMSLSRLL